MCDSSASAAGGDGGPTTGTQAASAAAPSAADVTAAAGPPKPEDSLVTWLFLVNDSLPQQNANPRIEKAIEWTDFSLYGDAELLLYMLPAEAWPEGAPLVDFVK